MRRVVTIVLVLLLMACSSIDCPLNTVEGCKYGFAGEVTVLSDTLTVNAIRIYDKDTTLLNRKVNASSFVLPMSYNQPSDLLLFSFTDSLNVTLTDTVKVYKTDMARFESVDCSPVFFHQINDVEWTRHVIDNIIISKSTVNYDTTGCNLHIYIKPGH
ncbi:MAG: hypothetical protein J6Y97_06640 [Prevotella sp.]|nr:hypothetical protein [Prevotella sp.]MBP5509015.1 hypothetical protein [Prevotella sp.]